MYVLWRNLIVENYQKLNYFSRFTLHEHGLYDLPASLKLCLNVSGRKKLSYVGHSMGTTTFLAMCSNNTNIATKIDIGILLAPVVEPSSMTNPIKYIAPVYQHVQTGKILWFVRYGMGYRKFDIDTATAGKALECLERLKQCLNYLHMDGIDFLKYYIFNFRWVTSCNFKSFLFFFVFRVSRSRYTLFIHWLIH